MNTSARDMRIAKRLLKKIESDRSEDVLGEVFLMNNNELARRKIDAIRICVLVKKLYSERNKALDPGSAR